MMFFAQLIYILSLSLIMQQTLEGNISQLFSFCSWNKIYIYWIIILCYMMQTFLTFLINWNWNYRKKDSQLQTLGEDTSLFRFRKRMIPTQIKFWDFPSNSVKTGNIKNKVFLETVFNALYFLRTNATIFLLQRNEQLIFVHQSSTRILIRCLCWANAERRRARCFTIKENCITTTGKFTRKEVQNTKELRLLQ